MDASSLISDVALQKHKVNSGAATQLKFVWQPRFYVSVLSLLPNSFQIPFRFFPDSFGSIDNSRKCIDRCLSYLPKFTMHRLFSGHTSIDAPPAFQNMSCIDYSPDIHRSMHLLPSKICLASIILRAYIDRCTSCHNLLSCIWLGNKS